MDFFLNFFNLEHIHSYQLNIYASPFIRFTPYLVGIFTGYYLQRTSGKRFELNWLFVISAWIATVAISGTCIFGLYDYFRGPHHDISVFARASYNNWSRLGWAFSVAWVIIACEKDLIGPLKTFFELSLWAPFSRLTYCAFIVHFFVIDALFSTDMQTIHFSGGYEQFVRDILPVLIWCFIFAYIWTSLFEVPFAQLETLALKGRFIDNKELKLISPNNGISRTASNLKNSSLSRSVTDDGLDKQIIRLRF